MPVADAGTDYGASSGGLTAAFDGKFENDDEEFDEATHRTYVWCT